MKPTLQSLKSLKVRSLFFAVACLAIIAFGLATKNLTNDLSAALDRADFAPSQWAPAQR